MKAGTAKKQKYVPIHEVANKLSIEEAQLLLPFHALTGCDATSYIHGHSKKSALKHFFLNKDLLADLGREPLIAQQTLLHAE